MNQIVLKLGRVRFGLCYVPSVLYKFFDDPDHAESFLRRGSVRIGTLYDFRRVETHDAARGDANEGRFDYIHRSAFPELITLDNASPPLRRWIELTGIPMQSSGGTFTAQGDHSDCYVYCVSAAPIRGVRTYGTHGVRIDDPPGFFTELTRHISKRRKLLRAPHGYAAPCLYRERRTVARTAGEYQEVPMAFIKPPDKANEREVRAVWYPASHPIEPFVTRCGALRPFLSAL